MRGNKRNLRIVAFSFLLGFGTISLFFSSAETAQVDNRFTEGNVTTLREWEFNPEPVSLSAKEDIVTASTQKLMSRTHGETLATLLDNHSVVRCEATPLAACPAANAATFGPVEPNQPDRLSFSKSHVFEPLLADNRWPHFSATYIRVINEEEFSNVGAVSFGESFGLYRADFPSGKQFQLDVEASVFSIFDLDGPSTDLINSDFWVAFPSISYCDGKFSALARLSHQSSHVGDEYLLRSGVEREEISYEAVRLTLSYCFYSAFRVYGGAGYLFHRTPPDLEPAGTQFGFEYESPRHFLNNLVRPVAAIDLQHHEENNWDKDLSLRIGVHLETSRNLKQRCQLMLEYYNGHDPSGQFYERKIETFGIGVHFYP